jgi:hypothetical protein
MILVSCRQFRQQFLLNAEPNFFFFFFVDLMGLDTDSISIGHGLDESR